jgi:hypothetical protein
MWVEKLAEVIVQEASEAWPSAWKVMVTGTPDGEPAQTSEAAEKRNVVVLRYYSPSVSFLIDFCMRRRGAALTMMVKGTLDEELAQKADAAKRPGSPSFSSSPLVLQKISVDGILRASRHDSFLCVC